MFAILTVLAVLGTLVLEGLRHQPNRAAVIVAVVVLTALVAVLLRFGTPLVDKLGPTGLGALALVH